MRNNTLPFSTANLTGPFTVRLRGFGDLHWASYTVVSVSSTYTHDLILPAMIAPLIGTATALPSFNSAERSFAVCHERSFASMSEVAIAKKQQIAVILVRV